MVRTTEKMPWCVVLICILSTLPLLQNAYTDWASVTESDKGIGKDDIKEGIWESEMKPHYY